MPVSSTDIMDLLDKLSREERLRVTVKTCAVAGLGVGTAAFLGGILGGPPGIAIGAALGGVGASCATHNKFQSVPEILASMDEAQKEELSTNVRHIIQSVNATDIGAFTALIAGNTALRNQVVTEMINFVSQEMNVAIQGGRG